MIGGDFSERWVSQDSLSTYADCETLVDDATIDLPAVAGHLVARITDGTTDAHIECSVFSDGSVSQITSRGTTSFTDVDGFFCVYDNGANARIRNRLGSKLRVCYEFKTYK